MQRNYLDALSFYPEIELARVNDLNAASAMRVAALSGAKVSTLEQLKNECEIIVIATPPASHAEIVEEVLDSGRIVICEKPFVGRRSDADYLSRLASDRHCSLFVAHFRRCFPSVRLGRSLVESGLLGAVTKISAYEGGRFSWQAESGYVYSDPFGGVLFDTGSHTLDMLLYVACLDTSDWEVSAAQTLRDCPEPAHDLEAWVSLTRDGDPAISGHFKFSRLAATANLIRVDCEDGFIELPVGMVNYVRLGKRGGKAVIVHARESFDDLMDCFTLQFQQMFFRDPDGTFAADRFINLAGLLESISMSD